MKTFGLLVKYVVVPTSSLIGIVYAFDMYVIGRAKTVSEPMAVKVRGIEKNVEEIAIRTRHIEKILMERK